MGLGEDQPSRLFNTRTNQSAYGNPVPVVMGTAQVEQSVFWVDGFSSSVVSSKASNTGGGKGGGKSGQYLYSADVVVGLCCGPIQGVGDVWSGQSWLGSPIAAESYTISSGTSYSHTPINANDYNNDLGVSVSNTYSSSNSDLGAPSPTVLSGSFPAPMVFVIWGAGQTPSTLTSGQYAINPSTNAYVFSDADASRVVTISYSYNVTNINQQQDDIVPSGRTISVSGVGTGSKVIGDLGVVYTTTGIAFTKVTGTPSVTGTYSVTGNNPAVYSFASGDINALVTVSYTVNDPTAISPGETTSLNYTLNNGTKGQAPYSFLTASYPDAAFGYSGIATLLYQPMDLGMGAEVQENRFEVITYDVYGGGIQDCNPVTCVYNVLTNSQWGLGVGTVPFPTACIDNGVGGTWGNAAAAGTSPANSTAWNWFASQGFFISPVLDGQDTASSAVSKWLEAGMCAAFYSEGLLKIVPYGDTSAAANGVTWTAPTEYVVALDDTCFLAQKDSDPVKISRVSAHDAWNVVQVQWDNRLNQYAPEITQESDQSLINRWGERREDPQDWDFIHTIAAATFAANMRIKHNGYIRNTYEFSLPYSYSYLEPMDIVVISTTSLWALGLNNANLAITEVPVRITKIVDDPKKGLAITCEDYPWGAHQPTLYNKQLNDSEPVANAYADPGNSEVILFEATDRLTLFDGDQIWIGALGTSDTWGATNIWVSQTSGGDYLQVGTINTPARLGVLHSTFASGSDPDTTHSMVVDLVDNCGTWEAGSSGDADADNTLVFVDGEIISYSALTYTGQNQITCDTYIRRGQMGSTISSHSTSGDVMRLDGAVFKYTYDPNWRGQTLYFKFQSVNEFGLMAQDLSTLTPVSFTIAGDNPGSIDAQTGLLLPLANPNLYNGVYDPTTAYRQGNEVTYSVGGVLGYYICILNTTGNPPTDNTYWQLISLNSSAYLGAFSGGTFYIPGNQVSYGDSYYICITATTGNLPTNPTYWQIIATANNNIYLGVYSGSTAYADGNQISYLGNYYICISASTGNAPPNGLYWTLVGTSALYIGVYDPAGVYIAGNEVTYNSNVYICTATTSGNAPTNASYWVSVTGNDTFQGVGNNTGTPGWIKVGTIVFGTLGESVSFDYVSGNGYNTTDNQQTTTTITMRTGNNAAAPNLSGVTWTENGGATAANPAVLNVKAAATGGSTSVSNYSWDLYMELGAYTPGTFIVNAGNDCSWTLINSASSDPGAASTTVVVGTGGYGLDGVANGGTRFPALSSTLSYRPTSNPLSSIDAGSNATIDIAAFNMQVSSFGTISYSSGSITALSYGTLYYIYFDDPTVSGGSVTYLASTTKTDVLTAGGQFYVGSIVTAVSGGPATTGNGDGGAGAQSGVSYSLQFSTMAISSAGSASVSNSANANDGNNASYATISASGNGVQNSVAITYSGAPGIQGSYTAVNLMIAMSIPTNSLSPGGGGTPDVWVVSVSRTGPGGGFSSISPSLYPAVYLGGVTQSLVVFAIPLDATTLPILAATSLNLGQLAVQIFAGSSTSHSSGSLSARVNEVWLQVIQ